MQGPRADEFAVECLWPGVDARQLVALEARIRECVAHSPSVRYSGLLLMQEDEVVLFRFRGPSEEVRRVSDAAAIPYERIIALTTSGPA